MTVEFISHNIRLDDGTLTRPEQAQSMDQYPIFLSSRRLIESLYPGDKSKIRLVDLGCHEGGYAIEFARMGMEVTGIEVRNANFQACEFARSRLHLPNLSFVQADAWDIAEYGPFDITFCSGLLYHLDRPKDFLHTVSASTRGMLILQTHFSMEVGPEEQRNSREIPSNQKYSLSRIAENEGLKGRWFTEFGDRESFSQREKYRWAAWGNRRSFWITREFLLQTIMDAGFDIVLEQFDNLKPNISDCMRNGYYRADNRGTFVGIKVSRTTEEANPRGSQVQLGSPALSRF